ncbi:LOW QUALITY PROTEIN: adenylyltransferase and sulfurtransferase MOCS3-like [Amphibalanus amphitrite]|uniref:LOW QUALITY PROTEIN: adenylyltransferase and sulfurtransferase MOCS3-like n=1 Tax=Amphibalanus amphitrite TaxID=1232801 RepID=UPI001C917962|nr:LOW QUALITY PROTEIN: adenylyltransferase and sulfurtransferase MOCS3-like [Amphibalanus amphitrite]
MADTVEKSEFQEGLSQDEAFRYSRQMILPEIGREGQEKLKNSSILIVGAGGLGCPAAIYLAAAGVGTLGVVDHDVVEVSNLHRQILHTEGRINTPKANSIGEAVAGLNHHVCVVPHHLALDSTNALQLVQRYEVVLDCTDNVATRYLLNDACVLAGRPLVSGSALRFEGQLTTYNYAGGPCYRCLYPRPPPPETVTNCSDGGVLGVVPGIIGSLQALEAVRLLIPGLRAAHAQTLLLFDGLLGAFRSVRLRGRQPDCAVCGDQPTVTELEDYVQFCGAAPTDKDSGVRLLAAEERLTPQQYQHLSTPKLLVDVRQANELDICRLPDEFQVLNVPLGALRTVEGRETVRQAALERRAGDGRVTVVTLCRRGNDSQRAAQLLQRHLTETPELEVRDIRGGLYAWKDEIDPSLLLY